MRKKGESNGNSAGNNLVRARRNNDFTVGFESQSVHVGRLHPMAHCLGTIGGKGSWRRAGTAAKAVPAAEVLNTLGQLLYRTFRAVLTSALASPGLWKS